MLLPPACSVEARQRPRRELNLTLDALVVQGTLKSDGTLELDQKPNLSPGRVTVILQPAQASTPAKRSLADVIDEIRQGQQARGFRGRSPAEIEGGLRE